MVNVVSPNYSTDDQIVIHLTTEPIFSGLYSYHIPTGTWTKLAYDTDEQCSRDVPTYRSRAGHSMLFHPVGIFLQFYFT